jgi:FkbM family methyltransferase
VKAPFGRIGGSVRDFVGRRLAGTPLEKPARAILHRAVGSRSLTWVERRNREYDAATVEVIRRVLKKDSSSVDAGANEGLILQELVRAAPDGTHFAFEPIPVLADRLRVRFPEAIVQAIALADHRGTATFRYLPESPALSSLYQRPDRELDQEVVSLDVPVERLDDVVPNDTRVDFLKVDVEGAERALFLGALGLLRRAQPTIVFECHAAELPGVADVLAEASYEIGLISDFLEGRRRPRADVERIAVDDAHWYFTAISASAR